MPTATVTVRELHNKDTGVDLTVASYKETKGLLGSTIEFNVVVVSRLAVFKSPKHRDTDVVQFTVIKKFNDFEDLHKKLNEKFSGTMFPPLPKKVLLVDDIIARERRGSLDKFVKLLAMTPKIATCSVLLQFLGVDPLKASSVKVDSGDNKATEEEEKEAEDRTDEDTSTEAEQKQSLFEEDNADAEDEELFAMENTEAGLAAEADIFQDIPKSSSLRTDDTRLFEDQDYGGAITEEDEKTMNMFVPDSIITTKKTISVTTGEDNSDLFEIEDDLDRLMKVPLGKKTEKIDPEEEKKEITPQIQQRPVPPPRSKAPKPAPSKPKPAPRPKPAIAKKPNSSTKESPKKDNLAESKVDSLASDDIMKYIQENASSSDADLDLFL